MELAPLVGHVVPRALVVQQEGIDELPLSPLQDSDDVQRINSMIEVPPPAFNLNPEPSECRHASRPPPWPDSCGHSHGQLLACTEEHQGSAQPSHGGIVQPRDRDQGGAGGACDCMMPAFRGPVDDGDSKHCFSVNGRPSAEPGRSGRCSTACGRGSGSSACTPSATRAATGSPVCSRYRGNAIAKT